MNTSLQPAFVSQRTYVEPYVHIPSTRQPNLAPGYTIYPLFVCTVHSSPVPLPAFSQPSTHPCIHPRTLAAAFSHKRIPCHAHHSQHQRGRKPVQCKQREKDSTTCPHDNTTTLTTLTTRHEVQRSNMPQPASCMPARCTKLRSFQLAQR